MRNRLIITLIVLGCFTSFFSCGKRSNTIELQEEKANDYTMGEIKESLQISNKNDYEVESKEKNYNYASSDADSTDFLKYTTKDSTLSEDYQNVLKISLDGTFELRVNLYSGMGLVRGNYKKDNDLYQFLVNDKNFFNVIGADIDEFEMRSTDNLLIYYGETMGVIEKGTIFYQY